MGDQPVQSRPTENSNFSLLTPHFVLTNSVALSVGFAATSPSHCHASPMCDGRLHSVSEHKQRALHTWFAFLATLHPTCT